MANEMRLDSLLEASNNNMGLNEVGAICNSSRECVPEPGSKRWGGHFIRLSSWAWTAELASHFKTDSDRLSRKAYRSPLEHRLKG